MLWRRRWALLQVAFASCMPKLVFLGVLACVLLAVAMSLARLYDRIPVPADDSPEQLSIWQSWQLVSGIFGLSVVPQVRSRAYSRAHTHTAQRAHPALLNMSACMCACRSYSTSCVLVTPPTYPLY